MSNDDAERRTETPHGFPTRVAAAIAILAALTFVDATPRIVEDPPSAQPHANETVPSACGADAVARARREVDSDRIRRETRTAYS